jgi:hypothetical protein
VEVCSCWWPRRTGKDSSQIQNICGFGDELVDRVFDAERFVEFARNGVQCTVSGLVGDPACDVAVTSAVADRGLGEAALHSLEFEFASGPFAAQRLIGIL